MTTCGSCLENLHMVNNPIYTEKAPGDNEASWRLAVLKVLPNLCVLDGPEVMVDEIAMAGL